MFRKKQNVPPTLHVCLIAANFPVSGRGGAYGFLWPVAKNLARLGHDVTVLTWGSTERKGEFTQDGVTIVTVGEGRSLSLTEFPNLALARFRSLHAKKPFHVVHSLDAGAALIAQHKREFQVAVAYDIEATQISQIFSIIGMAQETIMSQLSTGVNVAYKFLTTYLGHDRHLLSSADAVFVTSPPQRLALERYYQYPEFKTHLVPYGIEIGDLSPREKSEELRRKLNLPDSSQVVVSFSDMTELDVTFNLLAAFEKVAIKKPGARLLMVGNGPLFKDIEFEALSLALGSRVIFTGAVPGAALSDYISLADVYVSLSARTSGFESSLLEAMAQKKVIIGSEVSPISALVEDGLDGFLIRPADVRSLADLIMQVFNGEIDHLAIGERARAKVTKLFDSDRMLAETLSAYQSAMLASGFFTSRRINSPPRPVLSP